MTDLPSIAENIKAWRKHLGLTQVQVETRANLSHNSLSRIENGLNNPNLSTLEKIAVALGMGIDELQLRTPPGRIAEEPASYDVLQLSEKLEGLHPDNRRVVLQAFNAILDQIEK